MLYCLQLGQSSSYYITVTECNSTDTVYSMCDVTICMDISEATTDPAGSSGDMDYPMQQVC